jgi:surface antigen
MKFSNDMLSRRLLALALLVVATGVAADPPDWAPAHGHRGKHHERDDDEHREYRQVVPVAPAPVVIEQRYGVLNGHCNRQALGTVLGGVAGGVVGNQVGNGSPAATAIGTVVGALLGNAAGQSFDQADRGCSQQVLQYAQNGTPVQWANGATTYVMTPAAIFREGDRQCRNFVMVVRSGGQQWRENRRACRGPGDSWYVDN